MRGSQQLSCALFPLITGFSHWVFRGKVFTEATIDFDSGSCRINPSNTPFNQGKSCMVTTLFFPCYRFFPQGFPELKVFNEVDSCDTGPVDPTPYLTYWLDKGKCYEPKPNRLGGYPTQ